MWQNYLVPQVVLFNALITSSCGQGWGLRERAMEHRRRIELRGSLSALSFRGSTVVCGIEGCSFVIGDMKDKNQNAVLPPRDIPCNFPANSQVGLKIACVHAGFAIRNFSPGKISPLVSLRQGIRLFEKIGLSESVARNAMGRP